MGGPERMPVSVQQDHDPAQILGTNTDRHLAKMGRMQDMVVKPAADSVDAGEADAMAARPPGQGEPEYRPLEGRIRHWQRAAFRLQPRPGPRRRLTYQSRMGPVVDDVDDEPGQDAPEFLFAQRGPSLAWVISALLRAAEEAAGQIGQEQRTKGPEHPLDRAAEVRGICGAGDPMPAQICRRSDEGITDERGSHVA